MTEGLGSQAGPTHATPMRLSDVVPIQLAHFTYPAGHPLSGQAGLVNGFVVIRGNQLMLVDTGGGEGRPDLDELFRVSRRDLPTELRRRGLDSKAVTAIANCHLHFDHCGQNAKFPGVPIYVQRAEHELAQRPGYTVTEWVNFEGADYRLLEGDSEILPGIRALATPGHTPGHQSIVVRTDEGLVVLAGHAIYSAAEYAGTAEAKETSPEAQASARRLRELQPRRVLFGHDVAQWDAT